MGMPLEMNWLVVTKNNEVRIDNSDLFRLEKDGYRLYPLEIPINAAKTKDAIPFGSVIVKGLEWKNNKTIITYELIKLEKTVN